jgi:tetratricopeptide (TPR) repeat protein
MDAILVRTLFFVLVAAGLAAAPAVSASDWITVTSRNFLVIGDAPERDLRQVALRLEQFREILSRLFGKAGLRTSAPVRILVFRDEASFRPFRPVRDGEPVEVQGFFQASRDVHHIALVTGVREAREAVLHEYVHLLLHENSRVVPLWFAEGLAEYYSTFEVIPGEKRVRLGAPVQRHLLVLRDAKLPGLDELFAAGRDSVLYNEREHQGVFYAQSWALVHYLMLGKNQRRQPKVAHFLKRLSEGSPPEDSFRGIFETTFRQMEEELAQYLSRAEFVEQVLAFDQRLRFDRDMKSSSSSPARVEFYLGDLLAHLGRDGDAEARLTGALQKDANLAEARGALAMLRARQNRQEDAVREIDLAVNTAPEDFLLRYYRGMILSGAATGSPRAAGDSTERARADLIKSIELAPEFTEAYNLLAWVNLASGEQQEESFELIERALRISPGREELRITLGELHLSEGNWEEARQIIEPIARSGFTAESRQRAAALLQKIRRTAEEQAGITLRDDPAPPEAPAPQPESPGSAEPEPRGEELQGALLEITCAQNQLTLVIEAENRVIRLQSGTPDRIRFTSFTPEIEGKIKCGRRNPPTPVRVRYVKGTAGQADGEPLAVDFLAPDK